jgi:hypothetical protein
VAAGFAARVLSRRLVATAGLLVGLAVAGIAAFLFWQASAFPACGAAGPIRSPGEYAGPSVLVGLALGVGMSVGVVVAGRRMAAGSPVSATIAGVASQLAAMFLAILVATGTLALSCNRAAPPSG